MAFVNDIKDKDIIIAELRGKEARKIVTANREGVGKHIYASQGGRNVVLAQKGDNRKVSEMIICVLASIVTIENGDLFSTMILN